MSKKYPTQYHKLSKRDQKKHFSHEIGAGKGDLARKYTKEGADAYRNSKLWENLKRIEEKAKNKSNKDGMEKEEEEEEEKIVR